MALSFVIWFFRKFSKEYQEEIKMKRRGRKRKEERKRGLEKERKRGREDVRRGREEK